MGLLRYPVGAEAAAARALSGERENGAGGTGGIRGRCHPPQLVQNAARAERGAEPEALGAGEDKACVRMPVRLSVSLCSWCQEFGPTATFCTFPSRFSVLIVSLSLPQPGEPGAALGGPSPRDVLSAKELPVTGSDDNPGGTLGSTNISVIQHPWVAAHPSSSAPRPPAAPRDGVLTEKNSASFLLTPQLLAALGFVWQQRNRGEAGVSQTYGF